MRRCKSLSLLLLCCGVLALLFYLHWRTTTNEQTKESLSVGFVGRPAIRVEQQPWRTRQLCARHVDLLLLVNSLPQDAGRRQAIRRTWLADIMFNASAQTQHLAYAFIVGSSWNPWQQYRLRQEAAAQGDLLLVDLQEHFYHLPLKTSLMLSWTQQHCTNARCLVKADSDVMVITQRITHLCLQRTQDTLFTPKIYGRLWRDGKVVRDAGDKKKWVPRQVYANDTYPAYVSGTTYMMTMPAVHRLTVNVHKRPWPTHWPRNTPEDVTFTGIIATHANVPRFDVDGFHVQYDGGLSAECPDMKTVNIHGFDNITLLEQQWRVWKKLYCIH